MKRRLPGDLLLSCVVLCMFLFEVANAFLLGMDILGFPPFATLLLFPLFPISIAILLVGLITKRKSKKETRWRALALALSVICAGLFFVGGFRLGGRISDLGNRCHVSSSVNLDELQDWSIKTLEGWNEHSEPLKTSSMGKFSDRVPKNVQRLVGSYNSLSVSERVGNEKCVSIWFGGGFHHWGVVVGSKSFVPDASDNQKLYKWKDGVYGFQGP